MRDPHTACYLPYKEKLGKIVAAGNRKGTE